MNILGQEKVDGRALAISEALKEFHELARKFHCNEITPSALMGESGIVHHFSLLLASKGKFTGVDMYESIGEVEVLKTHVKKLDTGASAYLVSATASPSPETRALSDAYGVRIFTRSELDEMLETDADSSLGL